MGGGGREGADRAGNPQINRVPKKTVWVRGGELFSVEVDVRETRKTLLQTGPEN